MKTGIKKIISRAGLIFASTLLALFLAEVVLRLIYPQQAHYFIWQPNLAHVFYPDTSLLKGIYPISHFTINSYGVRTNAEDIKTGPNLFEARTDSAQYYLCMGGSTTECLYLDDEQAWPMQLQNIARAANSNIKFVGNIGKSGCTTRENYIQLKYCLPQYKKITGIILMPGNDLVKRLAQDTQFDNNFVFTPVVEDSMVHTIFLKQGRGINKTWWKRTALFYVLQKFYHRTSSVEWQIQDSHASIYKTWRYNRQHATKIIDTLPDLTAALNEYERNLNLIIDQAERQHLKIVFTTQTALWKDTMNGEELKALWVGGIGDYQNKPGCAYYSPTALRHGIELYNLRLKQVCAAKSVQVIDIDELLPHTLSVFYDDCHFNLHGAQAVAKIVAEKLRP